MNKLQNISKVFSLSNIFLIVFISIIAFCLLSSVYTVKENEVGILKTLGKITEITESGIHFKLPYPVQQVNIINIIKSHTFEIGYKDSPTRENLINNTDYSMLTSDDNIVWVDVSIEWKVSDPKAYLLNSKEPEELLKSAAVSCISKSIANSNIDGLLGDQKIHIQTRIKDNLAETINKYNIGIQIFQVQINNATPPNQVSKSFEEVFDALEQSKTLINKAQEYSSQKLPAAEGESQKLKYEAEAYYEERISKAKSETNRFNALLQEYKSSKEVTKTRLLIETLEDVLPNAKIYFVDDKNNIIKTLPIEDIGGAK